MNQSYCSALLAPHMHDAVHRFPVTGDRTEVRIVVWLGRDLNHQPFVM